MDPFTVGTISGMIANALTIISSHLWGKGHDFFSQKEKICNVLESNTDLRLILQKAQATLAKTRWFRSKREAEKLLIILVSPEVDAIVRQIFANQLSRDTDNYLELIRSELLTCISLQLGISELILKDFSDQLFELLIRGCEEALSVAIDVGILSAHEATSAYRHHIVLGELAAIRKNVEFLSAQERVNVQKILNFERRYRQQVGRRHANITPPNFDAARKVHINKLYVSPNFTKDPGKLAEESTILPMGDFISVIHRAVLLGNPGGGKSTFSFKLCHDLATRYEEKLFGGRQVSPILVILREYAAEKKLRMCSILQFIETTANSTYQIQPLVGAFDYLLLNGRVVVIFDGMDELLDTSYRQEVSGDIESFCDVYPSVPVLVTSRKVGYEQAPLDREIFETFYLTDFNDDQMEEYAKKWFQVNTDLSPREQKVQTKSFIDESRIVPDLRANPLMLALMCNIYRGENYIPRNLPDVYEKCAVMLFERWDKSRGIRVSLPFEAHIMTTLMYLAHWVYTDEALHGGVSEKSLIEKCTEYLCPRRYEHREDAEMAAQTFIDFCRGRAWVFTDTGTTMEGDRLYQFTHRTFLEYFTAGHVVRNYASPQNLGEFLLPKIARREWDVVSRLAFQILNKNVEGGADNLLSMLVEGVRTNKGKGGWNLLSFAVRCLEFIVPSPKFTREITTVCLEYALDWGLLRLKRTKAGEQELRSNEQRLPEELLRDLLVAASENRPTIADCLERILIERISKSDEAECILALETASNITKVSGRTGILRSELFEFWNTICKRILGTCSSRVKEMARLDFGACFDAFSRKEVSVDELVEWHGIEGLFRCREFIVFPDIRLLTIACSSLYDLVWYKRHSYGQLDDLFHLKEIGRVLLSAPPPWVKDVPDFNSDFSLLRLPFYPVSKSEAKTKKSRKRFKINSEVLFGAFTLLAVLLEASGKETRTSNFKWIKEKSGSDLGTPHRALLARFEEVSEKIVNEDLGRSRFTVEQQTFVWRWIKKEIYLSQYDGSEGIRNYTGE